MRPLPETQPRPQRAGLEQPSGHLSLSPESLVTERDQYQHHRVPEPLGDPTPWPALGSDTMAASPGVSGRRLKTLLRVPETARREGASTVGFPVCPGPQSFL